MAAAAAAATKAKFIDQIVTHPSKEWCNPREGKGEGEGARTGSEYHGPQCGEQKVIIFEMEKKQ